MIADEVVTNPHDAEREDEYNPRASIYMFIIAPTIRVNNKSINRDCIK